MSLVRFGWLTDDDERGLDTRVGVFVRGGGVEKA
jgi:hypothetical protein